MIIAAIGPEAVHNPSGFRRAVSIAKARLVGLMEG
jgi:hypothetical protein